MNRLQSLLIIVAVSALFALSLPARAQEFLSTSWCTHAGAERVDVHFNPDRFLDAFCVDRTTGHTWLAVSELRGSTRGLVQRWESSSRWCTAAGARLHFGDVDGDGWADLICRTPDLIAVDRFENNWLGEPQYYQRVNYRMFTNWCTHEGAIFMGFAHENSDHKVDMGCRTGEGYYWVSYSRDGRYAGTSAEGFAPDYHATRAVPDAGADGVPGFAVSIRNNSRIGGRIVSVVCSSGLYTSTLETALPRSMAGVDSGTVYVNFERSIDPGSVTCRVAGGGAGGERELIQSNNTVVPTAP